MSKTFGELISELRQKRGLSVYALAKQSGLSDQAVHDLEHGKRQPSLDTARRLAAALGVTLAWIDHELGAVILPTLTAGRPKGRPRKAGAAVLAAAPVTETREGGKNQRGRRGGKA